MTPSQFQPALTQLRAKGRSVDDLLETFNQIRMPNIRGKVLRENKDKAKKKSVNVAAPAVAIDADLLPSAHSTLKPGQVIEISHKGAIVLANYIHLHSQTDISSKAAINRAPSLRVRLIDGEEIVIDIGQVVSLWRHHPANQIPSDATRWASVSTSALHLLNRLSPRKKDLSSLWTTLCNHLGRSITMDSYAVAVYLFHEHAFVQWVDQMLLKRYPAPHDLLDSDEDIPQSNQQNATMVQLPIVSWEELMAASLQLTADPHFKRRPSAFIAQDITSHHPKIEQGLYHALDEHTVNGNIASMLEEYYRHCKKFASKETAFHPLAEGPYVHQLIFFLELLSSGNMSTIDHINYPGYVKSFFRRIDMLPSPQSARDVLEVFGHVMDADPADPSPPSSALNASISPPFPAAAIFSGKYVAAKHEQSCRQVDLQAVQAYALGHHRAIIRDHTLTTAHRFLRDGRVDLTQIDAVYSIDRAKTSYREDAISVDRVHGIVYVHIVDAISPLLLAKGDALPLLQTARKRKETLFISGAGAHYAMFPHAYLKSLTFAGRASSYVKAITVGLQINAQTGDVQGREVFLSWIRQPIALEMDRVGRMLQGGKDEALSELAASLPTFLLLLDRYRDQFPLHQRKSDLSFSSEDVERDDGQKAKELVHILLSLYSEAIHQTCQHHSIPLPLSFAQRNPLDRSLPIRCATQPLRHFLSLMQQRQVVALLKNTDSAEGASKHRGSSSSPWYDLHRCLTTHECALLVEEHKDWKRWLSRTLNVRLGALE